MLDWMNYALVKKIKHDLDKQCVLEQVWLLECDITSSYKAEVMVSGVKSVTGQDVYKVWLEQNC